MSLTERATEPYRDGRGSQGGNPPSINTQGEVSGAELLYCGVGYLDGLRITMEDANMAPGLHRRCRLPVFAYRRPA
jgi:hypothetical protein